MRWRGRRQSDNIDDVRNSSPSAGGGPGMRGIGFGLLGGGGRGIIILIVVFVVLHFAGIDAFRFLFGDGSIQSAHSPSQTIESTDSGIDDTRKEFVATVLASTEDSWGKIFAEQDSQYQMPHMTVFSNYVSTACGQASAAVGPFYCPNDQRIYLDMTFFDQLARQFDAPGEFAQAYVIAHEVGHHIQNLTGTLAQTNRLRASMGTAQANALSVRIELQADCYAGVWANSLKGQQILEQGDIEAALNAAHQIGDDTLQRRGQGQVVPDSFTHGTAEQRSTWFRRGFESGDYQACDTFQGQL